MDSDEPAEVAADGQDDASKLPFRKFSDKSGKFEVTARFIEVSGDKVTLEKTDGKRIDVPVEKLSEEDRDYINEQKL